MKTACLAEDLGLEVQIPAAGPAHRAYISTIRNIHFYELALVGTGMPNAIPPVHA